MELATYARLVPITLFLVCQLVCTQTVFGEENRTDRLNTKAIETPLDSEWPSYGRDYYEQRFSPLKQVNTGNVNQLGLAWHFDTDYARGLEATPLIVDGVMYVTGNWSVVYAVDARTGDLLWRYDPEVPKAWGKMACCDVVNRGVALYEGKVFVGTLDARLVALEASSGAVLWEVQTADITEFPYTITGAPRAAKGKVFIGNGGAEYGVRGYVSAYDVDSGELVWRFYTVPGNPADGFEDATQEMAAATWTGTWWKYGGGGTVWDSIVYDPDLDQLYIGVGNGSPWNRRIRSPGGGDNLFLSSIVALDPDTGEYIWHYQ
jgi:quinohemoprotein ethanol dehydrogenase